MVVTMNKTRMWRCGVWGNTTQDGVTVEAVAYERKELELVAVREVIVAAAAAAAAGRRRSECSTGRGGGLGRACGGRRDLDDLGSAKDLANINVGAVAVDLRVVHLENGGVDTSSARDVCASIIGLDNVSGYAVLASITKAEFFSRH